MESLAGQLRDKTMDNVFNFSDYKDKADNQAAVSNSLDFTDQWIRDLHNAVCDDAQKLNDYVIAVRLVQWAMRISAYKGVPLDTVFDIIADQPDYADPD